MAVYAVSTHCATDTEPRHCSSDCPPAEFDASAHPIIAQHWFGMEPFRPIDQVAGEVVADFKRQPVI